MSSIRRGDTVEVISGRDRGKRGKVLSRFTSSDRLLVQGVHFVKKAMRRTQEAPQGGIQQVEASIHLSNCVLVCPRCHKKSRVRKEKRADGKRVRLCKKCGEEL